MKLNGWQRLGIAVFVIWTFAASAVFWLNFHGSQSELLQAWLTTCRYEFGLPGKEAEAVERCFKEISDRWSAQYEPAYKRFWLTLPFLILVPALLAWGLISLVIVTMRWIRKGFG
jgi:hypothetical protein